jgi:hypothetical protein
MEQQGYEKGDPAVESVDDHGMLMTDKRFSLFLLSRQRIAGSPAYASGMELASMYS